MFEIYLLTTDGKEYIDVDCVREALGIVDEHVDILGVIKKLKRERDQLKEKCEKLKARANAAYGASCGYSGNKAPAFRCDVIGYSWEFGPIPARDLMDEPTYRVSNDSIRVELNLTPTANYKGTIDMEDLKRYIQEYGREKKLGVLESVDYQNAKAARAELAQLYKTVLGKEKLDRDLSPHEIMKAILDEYKRGRIERLPELVNDCIDELCDKYDVVQPDRKCTTKERLDYIFAILGRHRTVADEYRDLANRTFKKAEGFRKDKQALSDSLAELRAKIREIYRSVVDDEWDEHLSYTSAMNDINEEYKRVVHNFEERTADWSKERKDLDRYKLAVGSLCNIPAEHREDISWIEDAFNHTKEDYLKWQATADRLARFRSNICTALCLGGETSDKDILKAASEAINEWNKLIVFRNDVAKAIGLTWTDSNSDIINRVMQTKECHDKLCKDYTELRKAIWSAMDRKPEALPGGAVKLVGEVQALAYANKWLREFRDGVAEAICITYPTTNNFLLTRVSDIYKERGEAHDLAMELDRKCIDLTAKNSELESKWKEQYRLRQCWYVRWESENERANGEHKRAEKLRSDVTALKNHIELLKISNNARENEAVALQAFKNKYRELKDEKTKVIAALGQDIWDDCLKEENNGSNEDS